MAGLLLAAALALTPAGEFAVPRTWHGEPLTGLSGLTRIEGDRYYAVGDKGGLLYTLQIGVNLATGAPTNFTVLARTTLAERGDLEGVAWDATRRMVWVSDEKDASIRAFDPLTGVERAQAPLPPVFKSFRFNLSLEALALHPNGRELWTCNEESLVPDGPIATRAAGSRVRLQRLTRATPADAWQPAGQWCYETDRLGGRDFAGCARSGVADLLCLDDGALLALEREVSLKPGKFVPSFRCRIYMIDRTHADDVANRASLCDGSCRPVAKKRLFGADTGLALYEGLCLGPVLADGARTVLLVSDGDNGAANLLLALVLRKSPKTP